MLCSFPSIGISAIPDDLVIVAHEEILGLDRGFGVSEGHDGDAFAFFDEVGGTAVDENLAGVGWTFEDVGFEAGT